MIRRFAYNFLDILTELGGIISIVFSVANLVMFYFGHFLFQVKGISKFYMAKAPSKIFGEKRQNPKSSVIDALKNEREDKNDGHTVIKYTLWQKI